MDRIVDPTTALAVGLKVDSEALPVAVVAGIQDGTISLTDPATTVVLLKLDAVVGVKGTVETIGGVDSLTRVGFACALCHSNVDNSFAPGIGKRSMVGPIAISTSVPLSRSFDTGVSGNGAEVGNLTFAVPSTAPDPLFYDCSLHAAMTGTIHIMD